LVPVVLTFAVTAWSVTAAFWNTGFHIRVSFAQPSDLDLQP
jgi:hypothetical protein